MLRILHVVTYMGRGGLETMLMNYYRQIDRTQVQFDFLTHRDFEADYDKEILALGGKIYHISRLIPWSGAYKKELKSFFKAHPEYPIVHVHQDCLSGIALQCAKECGIPVRIAHSHSSSQDKDLKYPIKLFYKRKIPKYATDLFACGEKAGQWMFGGKAFQVLPNAIDTIRYKYAQEKAQTMRQQLGLDGKLVIGHVGRFSPAKNHSFLIDIFQKAAQLDDNAHLLLVGGGDGQAAIEEKVKQLGLSDRVTFTGVRSDVPELMQAMDVFAFPSLYEGLPVTMVEAQAAGLSCVISDTISEESTIVPELITRIGLSESPEHWAKILLEKAHQKRQDQTEAIQAAGYDIQTNAQKLMAYYKQKEWEAHGNTDRIYPGL